MNRDHFDQSEGQIPREWTTDLRRIARIDPHTSGWGVLDILPAERMRVYIAAMLFLFVFGGIVYATPAVAPRTDVAAVAVEAELPLPFDPAPFFRGISLRANAVYVLDVKTGDVLFERNADTQLPLASLTKVMTALIALDRLGLDGEIIITPEALAPEGDGGLPVGAHFNAKDLIDATLVASINDGAAALAHGAVTEREGYPYFIARMNKRAADIGMSQTYFYNETGLDIAPNVGGAYGTAHDMALLYKHILNARPELMERTTRESTQAISTEGYIVTATNTNKAISKLPFLLASKTGFTDLAGGNLAVAFDAGYTHPVVVVVLGSTEEGRFDDVVALSLAARAAVAAE